MAEPLVCGGFLAMELFDFLAASGLSVGKKIRPMKFKEVLPQGALEQDLEDLIVAQPSLLNWSDIVSFQSPDLLIISRQPHTQTRKRADLFAVSTDGELVIIEIKRDAPDEKGRREAMEFQAIRYAAASRKMTASAIIDMFADYLKKLAEANNGGKAESDPGYRGQAVSMLCKHLADENEELAEADLGDQLDPRTKQKIYLVAAGYEPDVLSACAWLREHEIDIACFRLRPYKIASQLLLERERLIPPPELDDFYVGMSPIASTSITKAPGSVDRRKSDKPSFMRWSDDAENEQVVFSWKDVLVEGTKRVLALGLPVDSLPMKQGVDGAGIISPREVQPGLHIETNASSELIMQWLSKMLQERGKRKGFLQIITRAGRTVELPQEAKGEAEKETS
jgi:hypothetical protein